MATSEKSDGAKNLDTKSGGKSKSSRFHNIFKSRRKVSKSNSKEAEAVAEVLQNSSISSQDTIHGDDTSHVENQIGSPVAGDDSRSSSGNISMGSSYSKKDEGYSSGWSNRTESSISDAARSSASSAHNSRFPSLSEQISPGIIPEVAEHREQDGSSSDDDEADNYGQSGLGRGDNQVTLRRKKGSRKKKPEEKAGGEPKEVVDSNIKDKQDESTETFVAQSSSESGPQDGTYLDAAITEQPNVEPPPSGTLQKVSVGLIDVGDGYRTPSDKSTAPNSPTPSSSSSNPPFNRSSSSSGDGDETHLKTTDGPEDPRGKQSQRSSKRISQSSVANLPTIAEPEPTSSELYESEAEYVNMEQAGQWKQDVTAAPAYPQASLGNSNSTAGEQTSTTPAASLHYADDEHTYENISTLRQPNPQTQQTYSWEIHTADNFGMQPPNLPSKRTIFIPNFYNSLEDVPKDISDLGKLHVADCLRKLDLNDYVGTFLKHNIDGIFLKNISKEALLEMGLKHIEADKLLLFAKEGWRPRSSGDEGVYDTLPTSKPVEESRRETTD